MDNFRNSERPYVVAAAVSHDLNDELTIILTSVAESIRMLDINHPVVELLIDLQAAALRCSWRSQGLLNFCARKGGLPGPIPIDRLLK